jgi:hypothetical protein
MAKGACFLGGEREPHRLLPAPSGLSANVFASLTAHQFTVNGFEMSTVLSTELQRLQRLGSLQRLYSPPQVTMGGTRTYSLGRRF